MGYTFRANFPIPYIDQLDDSIPHTPYTVADLVKAIQHNHPLSRPVSIFLSRVKVCTFYGFGGQTLGTIELENRLFKLNIRFDHHQTASLLLEMAREHLINMDEQYTHHHRLVRLWTFPSISREILESKSRRKELNQYKMHSQDRFQNLVL